MAAACLASSASMAATLEPARSMRREAGVRVTAQIARAALSRGKPEA